MLKGPERVTLIFFLKLCSLTLFSEPLVITSFSFGLWLGQEKCPERKQVRQSRLGFSKATHTGQRFCTVWKELTLTSISPDSNLRKSLCLWGSYHQWQELTLNDCSRKRTGSTLNSSQNWSARQGNKDQRYGCVPLLMLPSIPSSGHWFCCPWEQELSFLVTRSSFKVPMRACDWLSWGLFVVATGFRKQTHSEGQCR